MNPEERIQTLECALVEVNAICLFLLTAWPNTKKQIEMANQMLRYRALPDKLKTDWETKAAMRLIKNGILEGNSTSGKADDDMRSDS